MAFKAPPKTSKASGKPASKPARRKSRYAGAGEGEDREPLPMPGHYRFRVVDCNEIESEKPGHALYVKAVLEIISTTSDAHEAGDQVVFLQKTDGASADFGPKNVNRFIRPTLGFDSMDDLMAVGDEDVVADLIDACLGYSNEQSAEGNPLVGRLVECDVRMGRPVLDKDKQPTGDYYREHKWIVVPEKEQG